MKKRTFGAALAVCMAMALAACTEGRDANWVDDTGGPGASACAGCHGTEAPWAPAPDSRGNTDVSFRGVGAHQAHLAGGTLGKPVACDTCHVVPETLESAGHIDSALPAEVRFAGIAIAEGFDPEVVAAGTDAKALVTCRNVACHGAGLDGGTHVEPVWNGDDPSAEVACGSCHGLGPAVTRDGATHPSSQNCSICHETVAADGTIARPDLHMDGKVEAVGGTSCHSCHGSEANAAPPVDLAGNTDTTVRTVGAHQSHLVGTVLATALSCADCHPVPSEVDSPGHLDGTTQIVFGTTATLDDATPAWDATAETCAGSYCHGATLQGGSLAAPKWTVVDDTQAACGTCHGLPPTTLRSGGTHPTGANCSSCHDTVASDGSIAKPAQHIDGTVQVSGIGGCNACHGNEVNAAPPVDTHGGQDTSLKTVGAHQSHLQAANGISGAVACSDCHTVPESVSAAGHMDGTVQVAFKDLSVTDEADPAWDADAATCANTYCHGGTLDGGTLTTPSWTTVDGSQIACGSCHGLPPGGDHPQNVPACGTCHRDTATIDGGLKDAPATHIDGTVQMNGSPVCNTCHGNEDNDAPPADLEGRTDTALLTVGAHQAHLLGSSAIAEPLFCDACHVVPAVWTSPGHMDTLRPAEVPFGDFAKTGGLSPVYDPENGTCTNTYCHGASLTGGTHRVPVWNQVDGTQDACGSCHGTPPKTGKHPGNFEDHNGIGSDCTWCHQGIASGTQILDKSLHLNGKADVVIRNGTWVAATRTCDPACHGEEQW